MDVATLIMLAVAAALAFWALRPKITGALSVAKDPTTGATTVQAPAVTITPNPSLLTDEQVASEFVARMKNQAEAAIMSKLTGEVTSAAVARLTPISSALPVAAQAHPAAAAAGLTPDPKAQSGVA